MNEHDLAALRDYIDRARRTGTRRLPPEVQMTDDLNITRARLRGLLKKLEAEGLIWRHVGKGTFLGERSATEDLDALPRILTPPEAFEARLVIEPQLAALAARRATPSQIKDMRQCLAQMRAITTFEEWAQQDERLHRLVAKAAGNKLLLTVYDAVRESTPSGMRNIVTRVFSAIRTESNAEHEAYVDAIANHDQAAAESSMRSHLQAVRQGLFGDL